MNKCLVLFCVAGFVLVIYGVKRLLLKELVLHMLSGTAAVLMLNVLTGFFRFTLPLNAFTALVGAIGGLPGAILLTVLCGIWR